MRFEFFLLISLIVVTHSRRVSRVTGAKVVRMWLVRLRYLRRVRDLLESWRRIQGHSDTGNSSGQDGLGQGT